MSVDQNVRKCAEIVEAELQEGERILSIVLGTPVMSRADYITRFRVNVGKGNPSWTSITESRCFVIGISSNTGKALLDPARCDDVPDLPADASQLGID